MKVSYAWLQTYFKKNFLTRGLPKPAVLADLFNAHAFEVEGIEKKGRDTVFEFKVLPDRAHYALSHRGIAREASAITGLVCHDTKRSTPVLIDASIASPSVSVFDQKKCRRYSARCIRDIVVSESPAWLQTRLESIGARSINTIVDATNFVMFDVGQPLHAFDADKVVGGITVRYAHKGEKIVILDGREIELNETDLVVADDAGPLAIAGVKGGKRAEVTSQTKNIILESAHFDPVSVRKTSTRTQLRNDSSKRFENETTPAITLEALEQVTLLILSLSKGSRAGTVTDVYPIPVLPWVIRTTREGVCRMIGIDIAPEKFEKILSSLRISFTSQGDAYTLTPPLERLDVTSPEDIADEVGRLYGYSALPSMLPPEIPRVESDAVFYWSEKVKNAFVESGFSELLTYSLVPKGFFEIAHPLARDKDHLRENLIEKTKEALVYNARNADLLGLEVVCVFEIGKVFLKTGEKTVCSAGALQLKKKKGVTSEGILKEALDAVSKKIGQPLLTSPLEVGAHGAVTEIDITSLVSVLGKAGGLRDLHFVPLSKEKKYKPFSSYPFITRDIAFFTPLNVDEAKVRTVLSDTVRSCGGDILVKGPDLFDMFEKDGKKSYGFRFIFQSFTRTLSDSEIVGVMEKVYGAVKEKGWEPR